ncbi:uncharacterized protein LOC117818617 [Notolabrus celidotus]|uniref:uncharacterized protein LOC117818617 n=1 Tax=Notolabrus celidotus TaxID=1203425 RepID=UPI00149049E2|nr:uncharacterized protein LOC117818617 [Notolabrus celidotus]
MSSVELVKLGRVNVQTESDRLSVSAGCSLVMKKVTVKDVGSYTCRQYKSGKKQDPDSAVYLSVIALTAHEDTDEVTLECSVTTYGWCRHEIRWQVGDADVDEHTTGVKTSQSACNSSVTIQTSHYIYESRYKPLKCRVTSNTDEQLLPGEDIITAPGTTQTPINSGTTPSHTSSTVGADGDDDDDGKKKLDWLRHIIVSLGLVALIIIVLSVNMWTRVKGRNSDR